MTEILAIAAIAILSLAPMVLSIWGIHCLAQSSYLNRYRRMAHQGLERRSHFWGEDPWVNVNWQDPVGFIGDTSCCFNAHSPMIRSAVNPVGPCRNCIYYEPSTHLEQT
ncbi:MAG: DUF6464 family protein [Thermosynechococcaceae cyanobacterium]